MERSIYLITVGQGVYNSLKVSTDQEKKISGLLQAKRLPAKFVLNDTEIVSDNILGFSDKPVSLQSSPKFSSWEEVASNVRSQDWYKRGKKLSHDSALPS